MRFIVIGISDNPQPFFAPEVLEIIRKGKVFSGGKRHHDIVAPLLPKDAVWIDITVPLDAVFEQYNVRWSMENGQCIIVFASGDPLFFGFANTIRRKMPEAEVTVYPSFNSLQLLAHRLLMPYHDMRIVSLTGRPWPEFDRAIIERASKIGVLTDREHTPAAIARRLLDYGYTYYNIYIGEHLGNPVLEKVTALTLDEAAQRTFDQPNCIILEAPSNLPPKGEATAATKVTSKASPFGGRREGASFGLPDSAFALLDGREKMITKMPIRLLSLQALDLPRRTVLWDIGFCTGSISIEARLLFPHLQVEAFEIRPECEAIIHENARRFGAPGIAIHIGDFCSVCCDTVAAPDAVFIGGHGGQLKAIMAKACRYLRPGGVIVMNAVTVSPNAPVAPSRLLFDEACRELGLIQHPAMHIEINDYHPIDILKCELPS